MTLKHSSHPDENNVSDGTTVVLLHYTHHPPHLFLKPQFSSYCLLQEVPLFHARVFLAESDPVSARETTEILERAGYMVTVEGDGKQACGFVRWGAVVIIIRLERFGDAKIMLQQHPCMRAVTLEIRKVHGGR